MNTPTPYTGPIPDHIRDMRDQADAWISQGASIFFKWTCLGCGSRQTFEEPNVFYLKGRCEECSHITELFNPDSKPNFLVIQSSL